MKRLLVADTEKKNCIRAPFEVFVALRDIVKAKTPVDCKKRPIRNMAQSSRISVRDLREKRPKESRSRICLRTI